jgi:hypothetical protein
MSNPTSPETETDTGRTSWTLSLIGAFGSLLLFLFILFVTYLPQRDQDPLAQTTQQRLEILQEVEATAARDLASLEVVDPQQKTFKSPVDRAMELTVQEYKEKQP